MKRIGLAVLALTVCNTLAQAQEGQHTATGSVSGSVYLVMQNGDTKRGAGVTVYLLRDTKDLERWRDTLCPQRALGSIKLQLSHLSTMVSRYKAMEANSRTKTDLYAKEQAASEAQADSFSQETIRQRRENLAAAIVDTVGTGMEARYQFANVIPGQYVLFAEWAIADKPYAWWAPVEVLPGQSVKHDLDNSTEKGGALYCGAPPKFPQEP
jgi:hypothetical protein